MAAKSAVSAIIDKFNGIGAAHFGGTRPPIFVASAPVVTAASAAQRLPYVVLDDSGFSPEFNSGFGGIEVGEIKVTAYALKLDDTSGVTVDSIVRGIKWGGSAPGLKAGLDFGSLTFDSGSYLYSVSLVRKRERRDYAGFDYQGARVHLCELAYDCTIGLSPT